MGKNNWDDEKPKFATQHTLRHFAPTEIAAMVYKRRQAGKPVDALAAYIEDKNSHLQIVEGEGVVRELHYGR